jgi:uncharacterized repeat protein (TIGR03803 family)
MGISLWEGLVQASDGRLYGTTGVGGNKDEGTVFRFSNNGGLTTLIHFSGANGWLPATALMPASDGNLYGSTIAGGGYDEGTIFRLTTNGLFKVLVHFNGANGGDPEGGPLPQMNRASCNSSTLAQRMLRLGFIGWLRNEEPYLMGFLPVWEDCGAGRNPCVRPGPHVLE